MKQYLAASAAVLAAAVSTLATPAMAQDQYFEIINQSPRDLIYFYATPTHFDHWGKDLLVNRIIARGTRDLVWIADNQTTCVYDVMFVLDGDHRIEMVHDICAVGQFVLR